MPRKLRLSFAADEDAITERDEDWVEILRSVSEAVELLDGARVAIIRFCFARDPARPECVVSDKKPAAADSANGFVEDLWILVLVHIVEDQVEITGRVVKQFQGVTYMYLNE